MSLTPVRRTLIAAAAVLALAPATASAVEPGLASPGPGFQTAGINEADQAAALKAKWFRIFVTWADIEPTKGNYTTHLVAEMHQRVKALRDKGVKVLMVVHRTPAWAQATPSAPAPANPPANPADYGDFMHYMAKEFADTAARPGVSAWEIWNEPDNEVDNAGFWAGGPDPAKYSALLKAAYPRIKQGALEGAALEAPTVVTGGMVGNDYDFLADLYKNGAKGSFDAVGIHTDTACLIRDPGFYYREPDGRIGRFSFTAYREVKQVIRDNGEDKPLWMTEIGWSTNTNKCTVGAGAKEGRASGVSQEQQRDFLTQAYQCMQSDGLVSHALWFSLQDAGTDVARYDHFLGLIDRQERPKLAYSAFQALGAGIQGAFCGAKVDRDKPTVSITVPGTYFSRLIVKGSAADPTTKLSRIELWVDGKRVEGVNQDGPNYNLDWFGSTKLALGKHTVQLRAYDEAQNVGIATKEVVKANAANAPRTALARVTFTAKKKSGRRIVINARVLRALAGDFTEQPKGRMQIFFQRKKGSKWIQTSRYTKGIGKKIALTYKAKKPGKWRVFGKLAVDAPYKNTKTKTFQFKL